MKTVSRISFLFILLFECVNFCYSQSDTIKNITAKRYQPEKFTLHSFNKSSPYSISSFNNLHLKAGKTRFSFYDSPTKGFVLYDNSRREFLPIYQNNMNMDFNSAALTGGIEYLFYLIDKKGKYFEIIK